MSRFPYMSFGVDSYFEETGDLTFEEHGVLMLLVGIAWQRAGELPGNLSAIRRLLETKAARVHGHTFNRLVPSILERFFQKGDDGIYRNQSITAAIRRASAVSSKQAQNVGKRWANGSQNVGKQVSTLNDINDLAHTVVLPKKNKRIISTSSAVFARARAERAFGGSKVARAGPADFSRAPLTAGPALRAQLGVAEPPLMAAQLPRAVVAE